MAQAREEAQPHVLTVPSACSRALGTDPARLPPALGFAEFGALRLQEVTVLSAHLGLSLSLWSLTCKKKRVEAGWFVAGLRPEALVCSERVTRHFLPPLILRWRAEFLKFVT